ncbi:type I secretion system permease/ATPase [Pectobacterium cacticida]|uniref:Type I secretion system permease/ATPase n=1 Tax=Pectobacterium cacticida TaxID=69221 RepID=A0ABZ2GHE4_9GAMM|nr:type I secretion system permease/ATPase [Pectobacterium cacticida]UYX05556.1 type I secretion system permease/ATPase [Pectobacterium cacticida]
MTVSHPASSGREIIDALAAYRQGFWGIGLFSAVINLLMLAPAIYMLQVYDRVLPASSTMTLAMLTIIMLGLFLLMGLLEWVRSAVVIRLGTQMDMRLNQRIFNAAFESNLRNGSASAGQALNDLTALRQFATGNALFAFFDAPWFPVYLLVIFLLHPWLGVMALAGAIILITLAWLNQKLTREPLSLAAKTTVQATQQASVNLRNADAIEAMGMLQAMRERWLTQHRAFLYYQNIASEKSATITSLTKSTRLALQSLMLGLGALLAVNGEITPGMMIAGSILVSRVLSPIDQIIGVWKQWMQARLAWQRVNRLLDAHPVRAAGMSLPAPQGKLQVEQLSANAPNTRTPILANITFELFPGDVLGVLGPSGSGKSTLARLLVAAMPALGGKIRLDGADMHQWDKGDLGRFIGYLPQDVQLFSGTIAENIARFTHPDAEKIVAAAITAGVHEMILRLPQGYDTQLGEGGAGLSGGQKQRIALARAIYNQPRLIVMDEPNASLDDDGEKALLAAIAAQQKAKSTQVLITHKPALLSCANKLLVLRAGQIQYFGATAHVLKELQRANTSANKPITKPASANPTPAKTADSANAATPKGLASAGLSMVYSAPTPRRPAPDK